MMKIAYRTLGQRGSPAVLLLHGFMGSGSDWEEVAQRLSGECFCVLPDLPGHGGSCLTYAETDYTFPSTAASIIAVLDELELKGAVIAGYSMGGRIALFTALEHSDRVRGLFIESASPGLETEPERQRRAREDELMADRLIENGISRFVDEWYEMPLFENLRRSEVKLAAVKLWRKNNDALGLAMSLRCSGTGVQPPLWSRLSELVCPVRIVHGALDSKFASISMKMAELVPNARVDAVSGAGHAAHVEMPDEISELLLNFVGKCW